MNVIRTTGKRNVTLKVLVLSGPNLNMLGRRAKEHYGTKTLDDIILLMKFVNNVEIKHYQSNHEGDLVDYIQKFEEYDGLIINPAAYTHTSIAIRDALEVVTIPKIEVHLSDIYSRENFRHVNYISDVVDKSFIGLREQGYIEALKYLKEIKNVL